jgi:hypothetical protein
MSTHADAEMDADAFSWRRSSTFGQDDYTEDEEDLLQQRELLSFHVLTLVRLSVDCPFADVRRGAHDILDELRTIGVPIPTPVHLLPSLFIDARDTPDFFDHQAHDDDDDDNTSTPDEVAIFLHDEEHSWTGGASPSMFSNEPSSDYDDGTADEGEDALPMTTDVFDGNQLTPRPGHSFPKELCDKFLKRSPPQEKPIVEMEKQPSRDSEQADRMRAKKSTDPSWSRKLLVDTYIGHGRVAHAFRIMSYFPSYLSCYQKAFYPLVKGGPLPRPVRYYIGIMAAAEHSCQYLVSALATDYLQYGGDPKWLQGLAYTTNKMKRLGRINTLLARSPHLISDKHIAYLVRGDGTSDASSPDADTNVAEPDAYFHYQYPRKRSSSQNLHSYHSSGGGSSPMLDNWSMSEVAHGLTLLAEFHSFASFCMASGVAPELDALGGTRFANLSVDSVHSCESATMPRKPAEKKEITVMDTVATVPQEQDKIDLQTSLVARRLQSMWKKTRSMFGTANDPVDKSDEARSITSVESTPLPELPPLGYEASTCAQDDGTTVCIHHNLILEDMARFLDREAAHQEMKEAERGLDEKLSEALYTDLSSSPTSDNDDSGISSCGQSYVTLEDYSWEDHAMELVNRYLPEHGEFLDQVFQETMNMTDYSMTSECTVLDTFPLRQAMWYHVLSLFKLSRDDYDCAQIPFFLNARLRDYLERVVLRPEQMDSSDFDRFGLDLRTDEKVHVTIIACEGRKQAELVYGMLGISRYLEGGVRSY